MENKEINYDTCTAEIIAASDIETAMEYYNKALTDKKSEKELTDHAREIVQAFFDRFSKATELFAIYLKNVPTAVPVTDPEGIAWFFTREEYALAAGLKNGACEVRPVENKMLQLLIRYEFRRFGINRIRINPATKDKTATVAFSFNEGEFVTESMGDGILRENAEVNSVLFRYNMASAFAVNSDKTIEVIRDNFKAMLFNMIKASLFIMPLQSDKEKGKIHYTGEVKKLIETSGVKYRFFSTEKKEWAKEPENGAMQISTVNNKDGQQFLPVFTDFIEYDRLFKNNSGCSACVVSFKEIAGLINNCAGFVINCGGVSFTVSKDMINLKTMEFVEEEEHDEERAAAPSKENIADGRLYILTCKNNPLLINDQHVSVFTAAKRAKPFVKNGMQVRAVEGINAAAVFSQYKLFFGIDTFILNGDENRIFNIDEYFDITDPSAGADNANAVKNPKLKKALMMHSQYAALSGTAENHDTIKSALLYNVLDELDNTKIVVPVIKNEDGTFKMPMMKNPEGEMLMPVFTDVIHLMQARDKTEFSGAMANSVRELYKNATCGFAVNPYSGDMAVFSREAMGKFFETSQPEPEQKRETEEAEPLKEINQNKKSFFGRFRKS